jgi:general secretion pathway protein D
MTVSLVMAREEVNINFHNLKISDFIKLIGKVTDKNILVHHKITGTVDMVTTTPIYDDEVLGILVSVLESKGFTLIQKGSMYEVIRSSEATKHNLKIVKPGKRTTGSMMVTQSISIKGENVDVIASKVRYLISKTAKLMTLPSSNTLLITDYPKNIETIKRVVSDLAKGNKMAMTIVAVKHAEIKSLHAQIKDISQNYFNEKIEGEKVTVLLDTNVNSLVLIGKQKNIDELLIMIENLDKERDLNEIVQIYNLKNSDAKNVKESLDDIIKTQTFKDPTLQPNISLSEEINSIIVVGDPNVVKGMIKIIEELDKEKYQVYVQARIVEINNRSSEDIGIRYGMEGGMATTSALYTFSGNFGGATVPISDQFAGKLIDSIGNVDQYLVLGATLDFLQSQGASKTISNPSILCVNNKESSIYVGKTLSIATGSINANTGSTTNSFKRDDIGLSLKIKPRVSSQDKVTLTVETTLENVVGVDGNDQPITTKQTVNTESILRHGESIVIGGLVKNYVQEIESKIPLLGDIPLLGWFFRWTNNEEQQDNLLVMLTPYVIDQSEKLSILQQQLGELGRLQQEYNKIVFPLAEEKAQEKATE